METERERRGVRQTDRTSVKDREREGWGGGGGETDRQTETERGG